MGAQEIIMAVLSGCIGFICYLLKDLKNSLKEKLDSNHDEIKKTQKDLQMLQNSLPQTYVFRDDFLRAVSNLDTKVDRVAAEVSHINENVAKLVSGGEKG